MKWTCWTTGSWWSCLSLEVVSSIPAGSTIIYRFLCGFICISLCQSINIKPTNMYIYILSMCVSIYVPIDYFLFSLQIQCHCGLFEDQVPLDLLSAYPIFKWSAVTWQGWYGTRMLLLCIIGDVSGHWWNYYPQDSSSINGHRHDLLYTGVTSLLFTPTHPCKHMLCVYCVLPCLLAQWTVDWAPSQYKDRLISVWRFLC